jgi:hypothetical protein
MNDRISTTSLLSCHYEGHKYLLWISTHATPLFCLSRCSPTQPRYSVSRDVHPHNPLFCLQMFIPTPLLFCFYVHPYPLLFCLQMTTLTPLLFCFSLFPPIPPTVLSTDDHPHTPSLLFLSMSTHTPYYFVYRCSSPHRFSCFYVHPHTLIFCLQMFIPTPLLFCFYLCPSIHLTILSLWIFIHIPY